MARCTPRTTRTLSSPSRHSISLSLSFSPLSLRPRQRRTQQKGGPDRQRIGGRTASPASTTGDEARRQLARHKLILLDPACPTGRSLGDLLGDRRQQYAEAGRQARGAAGYACANTCGSQIVSSLSLSLFFYLVRPFPPVLVVAELHFSPSLILADRLAPYVPIAKKTMELLLKITLSRN